MNYQKLIDTAIKNDEMIDLLCGKNGYEVQTHELVAYGFPTDIQEIVHECIYKQKKQKNIQEIFENSLICMLRTSAAYCYIAINYFDFCLFCEEKGMATFSLNREKIAEEIKIAVDKYYDELSSRIYYDNGTCEENPLLYIGAMNKKYEEKYSLSIIPERFQE